MSQAKYFNFGKGSKFVPPTKAVPKSELSTALDRVIAEIDKTQDIAKLQSMKATLDFVELQAQKQKIDTMEKKAVELKFWVEEKLGKVLIDMKEAGTLAEPKDTLRRGTSEVPREKTSLADLNVSKNESSKAQKLAKLPESEKREELKQRLDKVGKKRPHVKKPIDAIAQDHVHEFVLICSKCGARSEE